MTSYLIIVNPKSGNGGAARKASVLRDRLAESCGVRVVETTHRGSATELAAAAASEVDRVVAVGGDGTLNEVLTGLMSVGEPCSRLPALGFLPAGTANAAIQAFGFTSSPEGLAQCLPDAPVRPVDVGMVHPITLGVDQLSGDGDLFWSADVNFVHWGEGHYAQTNNEWC